MSEVSKKYESYVHISNSGYSFQVEIENTPSGYTAQYLTTALHAFGLPHETKLWLDDNTLDALEYILGKAREQREAYSEELKRNWEATNKAVPPHSHTVGVDGSTGPE